jgi:cytochrome c peroxidase
MKPRAGAAPEPVFLRDIMLNIFTFLDVGVAVGTAKSRWVKGLAAWTTVALLAACGSDDSGPQPEANDFVATPNNGVLAVSVGEGLFKDPALSASGKQSCATCHDEEFGHADKPGVFLPLGGAGLNLSGMRSSPSTRYLNRAPAFALDAHGAAYGGFTWDGRADTRRAQARNPFFVAEEMALPGSADAPQALLALVRKASYFNDLLSLYKKEETDTDEKLFKRIVELLEIYQRDDADYNLFDSKYDQVLAGTATLSAAEARGLALFNDSSKGNCASCHTSSGSQPLFTNFGFAALGLPRNHQGPKNADASFFDLGLCARSKDNDTAVKGVSRYCGQFKTPTLRNVARSAPYFHNGSIATLEDAIRFHFTRDTDPGRWYKTATGAADRSYNDLPAQYQGNLVKGQPFAGGYQPSDADIADLMAFLATLNDADQLLPVAPAQ